MDVVCLGQFVHRIDPVLVDLGPIQIWYYGLAYCVGFVGVHVWLRQSRMLLGLTLQHVDDLSLAFTACVLIFGRAFEVIVYEWGYYSEHPQQLLSYWRGGMASHGVLVGGALGTWLFCRLRRQPLLAVMDEIVVPGALFLALGRIGNFINGQIYGSITDVWCSVQFPGTEDFRHPVTLYESFKNLAIIPVLLFVRRRHSRASGLILGHFVFWYGFLRIVTDYFREYGTEFLGIGTGQYFNVLMATFGLGLIVWRRRVARKTSTERGMRVDSVAESTQPRAILPDSQRGWLTLRRIIWIALLFLSLTIPSGWTYGVLEDLRDSRRVNDITQVASYAACDTSLSVWVGPRLAGSAPQ